ncbi:MAG: isoprenylcysteine carboxylmethyltransferase family protein [Chloroflexi bacterium]|nr:isoprenylcysteine carboxylmethyltransferase family protein [Chloroflexota bacterium]
MTDQKSPEQTTAPASAGSPLGWKVVVRLVLLVVTLLAILFIAAGTLHWPMAWAYAIQAAAITFGSRLIVIRRHPDLITERAQSLSAEGGKSWDKIIVQLVAIIGPLLTLIVCGLDVRFGWRPEVPLAGQIVAFVLMTLGSLLGTWAMLVNRFFSAVVRIQTDRGHTVVSDGPYRFVRHPAYAGGVVANLAGPLALGSVWALIPGGLIALLFVVRTALEDKTLREELPGYQDYAARVRHRLLPGIW